MKNGCILFMVCAITIAAAASNDGEKKSEPSAGLSPAQEFSDSNATTTHPSTVTAPTTLHPNTTTPHPNTTTPHPNTTTPHPNTTTPHPKTTTPHPNTTTPHPNTTTPHPNTTTPHPNTTTPHPNTTTPHPNTTTPHPNTTTPHPNTTTPHPNTTTPHPKTTTPHPKTTTPHPKTTTPHPNTTTHAPPTHPPPKPTPSANLTVGNYTLKKGKNVCAYATMALQIRVEYGPTNKEGKYIVQAAQTNVTGECGNSIVNFNITFKEGFIDLRFQKNLTEKSVYVSSVAVGLIYPFPAATKNNYAGGNNSVQLFRAAIGHSYSCKNQSVYLGHGVHLDMTKGRIQAFNLTNGNGFGVPDPCPADKPDYRAAIAVGIVLLILIVIVVVAYIIGRRKRTDGYQSL